MRPLLPAPFTIAAFLGLSTVWAASARQPNIILLLADDLGYGELGCQGNAQIPTPHIDSIAARGVRFTQGYVTAPNCSPSRAGLITGRIPTRFGYEFNPIGTQNEHPAAGLPASEKTLAEALHDAGYTTGLIGKWHLGGSAVYHPHRHGFDQFFGFTHEGHYYAPPPWEGVTTMLRRKRLPGEATGRWLNGDETLIYTSHMGHDEPAYDANNPIVRGGQPHAEPDYLTNAFTREAVDFIGRHADKPFFLMVAYNAVHSPLQARNAHMKKFAHIEDIHRRIFAAMVAHLDDGVGAILGKVGAEGLEEETLIIFLSDNGGATRELTSSNRPLRGEKGQVYEGGLRVPFMMRWPGVLPEGEVRHEPVWSPDLYPTLTGVAGADGPHDVDGKDLMPLFSESDRSSGMERTFFWRQGHRRALRHGPWKLVTMKRDPEPAWELYNLDDDVSEETDLASEHPEMVEDLARRFQALEMEMAEPLFR